MITFYKDARIFSPIRLDFEMTKQSSQTTSNDLSDVGFLRLATMIIVIVVVGFKTIISFCWDYVTDSRFRKSIVTDDEFVNGPWPSFVLAFMALLICLLLWYLDSAYGLLP